MAAQKTSDISGPKKDKSSRTYSTFFLEYSLMAEYNLLQKQNLPGVYVLPSARTPLLWFGVIFVRQGLYQSGIFKFCVVIPQTYPDSDCPKIVFDRAPFHPLIDPNTGELDVQRAFPTWKRNVNHIWNVLLYIRRIFYKIDIQKPLNPEAAVLYERELTQFKNSVMKSIEVNRSHLYDKAHTNDPHEIHFVMSNNETTEKHKRSMLESIKGSLSDESSTSSGLSWVAHGSSMPFSKSHRVV